MSYQTYLWPTYKRRLLHSSAPILVGPWHSEVGFEALYWLPFLDRLVADGVDRSRFIPITRGGAAVWYQVPRGIELFAMRDAQTIRVENRVQQQRTGLLKQIRCTPFDRAIYRDVAATLNLGRYQVLHPHWMYQTLAPYWNGERGLDWLAHRATLGFLPPPPLPEGVALPETFVAVRFYFRSTFPMHPQTMACARGTIERLAQQWPVVLLNSDTHADEHLDCQVKGLPNVYRLKDVAPMLSPENNLWVQSAVLAKALGFVGTYGGLAQLALRLGRPSVSFYTDWQGTSMAHKHLADAISLRSGVAFAVHALREVGLIQSVLPGVASPHSAIDTAPLMV